MLVSSRGVGGVSAPHSPNGSINLLSLKRAEAGRRGFETTTRRWFCGSERYHRNWLRVHAPAVYARSSSRGSGFKFSSVPIHPSKLSERVRFQFLAISLSSVDVARDRLFLLRDYLSFEEYACIFSCLYGRFPSVVDYEGLPF